MSACVALSMCVFFLRVLRPLIKWFSRTGIYHNGKKHELSALAVWSEEEIKLRPGCEDVKASSPRTVFMGQRLEYVQARTVVGTALIYPPFMDNGYENEFTYDSVYDDALNKLYSIEQPLTSRDAHRRQFISAMKMLRLSVLRGFLGRCFWKKFRKALLDYCAKDGFVRRSKQPVLHFQDTCREEFLAAFGEPLLEHCFYYVQEEASIHVDIPTVDLLRVLVTDASIPRPPLPAVASENAEPRAVALPGNEQPAINCEQEGPHLQPTSPPAPVVQNTSSVLVTDSTPTGSESAEPSAPVLGAAGCATASKKETESASKVQLLCSDFKQSLDKTQKETEAKQGGQGKRRKEHVSKRWEQELVRRTKRQLAPVVGSVGSMFSKKSDGKEVALSKAVEGHRAIVEDSLQACGKRARKSIEHLEKKKVQKSISEPGRWVTLADRGGLSEKQIKSVETHIFQERDWVPCSNIRVGERQVRTNIMQSIMPITKTKGEGGHEIHLDTFFKLILPAYYDRLKRVRCTNYEWEAEAEGEWSDEELAEIRADIGEWDLSFDARTSKSGQLTYTSFVVSPKIAGLENEWQSPKFVWTLLEMDGYDKAPNLKENCMDFWDSVQRLEDGGTVDVKLEGACHPIKFNLKYPADMASQWAQNQCGGRGGKGQKPCHRCNCLYEELPIFLDAYEVKELRVVNLQNVDSKADFDRTKENAALQQYHHPDQKNFVPDSQDLHKVKDNENLMGRRM
ncbi:hypothetical protein CYMTET_11101 [Cymbomonas tetramitiformis]|uniref:Uncharacterized protein n=1 Tax=Cymbomonas tetramitiformis TaxID=36881 RepID=A0AAE0GMV1_9CHLO|nr:hypothetical protein CYMTET_11101 [Cymbomonas tetramitiformis]